MTWRHEWKHEINVSDLLQLRQRLGAVMEKDSHAADGKYEVRSLYFDTPGDKALREKIDGVDRREKFRLRYYNRDHSRIWLEKKSRRGGLGNKQSTGMSGDEAQAVIENQWGWMMDSGRPLVEELYCKMKFQGLRPKTIVDYTREPLEGVNKIAKTIENKGFSRKGKADGKNFVRWKPLHILERCKEKRQGKTAVRHGLGIVFKL